MDPAVLCNCFLKKNTLQFLLPSWLFSDNNNHCVYFKAVTEHLCFQVKQHIKMQYERDGKKNDDPFYEKIMNDIFYKNDKDKDGLISAKEYNIYQHDEL